MKEWSWKVCIAWADGMTMCVENLMFDDPQRAKEVYEQATCAMHLTADQRVADGYLTSIFRDESGGSLEIHSRLVRSVRLINEADWREHNRAALYEDWRQQAYAVAKGKHLADNGEPLHPGEDQ